MMLHINHLVSVGMRAFGLAAASFVVFMALTVAVAPAPAHAYAIGSTTPTSSPLMSGSFGGYNFTHSFQVFISSFTSFFHHIQAANGNVSFTTNAGGGSGSGTSGNTGGGVLGAAPPVTVTVHTGSYVRGFETWFYNLTGVHTQVLFNILSGIVGWFGVVAVKLASFIFGSATAAIAAVARL